MLRLLSIILMMALLVGLPRPSQADVMEDTFVDPSLVAPLMAWVEHETGVKVPALPLVIASRTQFAMVLRSMGEDFAGRPQSAYVPGAVYLDHLRWDSEDPTQMSLLVHELVHHAQMFMKTAWTCPEAREEQAYRLQNTWLEQHGHHAFVNIAWIERVSSCGTKTQIASLAQNQD